MDSEERERTAPLAARRRRGAPARRERQHRAPLDRRRAPRRLPQPRRPSPLPGRRRPRPLPGPKRRGSAAIPATSPSCAGRRKTCAPSCRTSLELHGAHSPRRRARCPSRSPGASASSTDAPRCDVYVLAAATGCASSSRSTATSPTRAASAILGARRLAPGERRPRRPSRRSPWAPTRPRGRAPAAPCSAAAAGRWCGRRCGARRRSSAPSR